MNGQTLFSNFFRCSYYKSSDDSLRKMRFSSLQLNNLQFNSFSFFNVVQLLVVHILASRFVAHTHSIKSSLTGGTVHPPFSFGSNYTTKKKSIDFPPSPLRFCLDIEARERNRAGDFALLLRAILFSKTNFERKNRDIYFCHVIDFIFAHILAIFSKLANFLQDSIRSLLYRLFKD